MSVALSGIPVPGSRRTPPPPEPPSAVIEDLRALLGEGTGDVTIAFSDGTASAHSVLLGARSGVMKAMLAAPMQEARTSTIEMSCCTTTGLVFLRFLYTGEFPQDWPASTLEACDTGRLIDYYGVSGIDKAFGKRQREVFLARARGEFPPQSSSFWDDVVGLLRRPEWPPLMRQCLVADFAGEALVWGQNVFLALCVADAAGVADLKARCMETIQKKFMTTAFVFGQAPLSEQLQGRGSAPVPLPGAENSNAGETDLWGTSFGFFAGLSGPSPTSLGAGVSGGGIDTAGGNGAMAFSWSEPTRAPPHPPAHLSPVSSAEDRAKDTGLDAEFSEARLKDCIARTTPMQTMRNFLRVQAGITRVMKYRTEVVVTPSERRKPEPVELKFNRFQSLVHCQLASISGTLDRLIDECQ